MAPGSCCPLQIGKRLPAVLCGYTLARQQYGVVAQLASDSGSGRLAAAAAVPRDSACAGASHETADGAAFCNGAGVYGGGSSVSAATVELRYGLWPDAP